MKEVAPLTGPDGLYTVSVWPRFLADSSAVGWQGAFFTDIVGAPAGVVDHGHQHYCLIRSFAPVGYRLAGRTSWQTQPAGIELACPGHEHRRQWLGSSRSQFLFIAPERVEQLLDGSPAAHPGACVPSRCGSLTRLFQALELDLSLGSPAGRLAGDGLIAGIVGQFVTEPTGRGSTVLGAAAQRRVVDAIEDRLAFSPSLRELAGAARLGERQFLRAFRATMGQSPHQYLLARRVEQAKRLITQGLPLAEVALACGFADQSQLTRTFGRRTGVTPARWRDQQRR